MKLLMMDDRIVGVTADTDIPASGNVQTLEVPAGYRPDLAQFYEMSKGKAVLNSDKASMSIRAARLAALNEEYTGAMAALRASYPEPETLTWSLQLTEAKAFKAWADGGRQGDKPETPFLSALSAGRDAAGVGDGFEDLVARVLKNDAIYTPAVAKLTALRHAAEIEIQTAPNLEALAAVTWSFLP